MIVCGCFILLGGGGIDRPALNNNRIENCQGTAAAKKSERGKNAETGFSPRSGRSPRRRRMQMRRVVEIMFQIQNAREKEAEWRTQQ